MFKKGLLFLAVSLFSHNVLAGWVCQEAASVRDGNRILACGIGEAESESEARLKAFENAEQEYKMLCARDVRCKGYKTEVNPARNTCKKKDGVYKCYRGLEYYITKVKDVEDNSKVLSDLEKEKQELERKYLAAQQKYKKKQEIEALKRKIKEKDFSDKIEPSKSPSSNNQYSLYLGSSRSSVDYGTSEVLEEYDIPNGLLGFAIEFQRLPNKKAWIASIELFSGEEDTVAGDSIYTSGSFIHLTYRNYLKDSYEGFYYGYGLGIASTYVEVLSFDLSNDATYDDNQFSVRLDLGFLSRKKPAGFDIGFSIVSVSDNYNSSGFSGLFRAGVTF